MGIITGAVLYTAHSVWRPQAYQLRLPLRLAGRRLVRPRLLLQLPDLLAQRQKLLLALFLVLRRGEQR